MKTIWIAAALLFGALAPLGARAAEPLVTPEWLAGRLGDSALVVLDVRNGIDGGSQAVFEQGHIPGAVYSDYGNGGWRVARDGVPAMLPPVADLETLIGGLGIGNGDHVVIVPAGVSAVDYGSATRVFWTFQVLGHRNVSILDGGWTGWTRDPTRPVATGPASRKPVAFKADFQPQLLASRDDVKAALANGVALIDNRPAAQYEGAAKHPAAARFGTIPGAVNVPQEKFFDAASGRFANPETVATLWKDGKLDKEADQIAFCNTGHWASLGWFADFALLGNSKARLYDGSMTDWSADASLPMANTENPARK